MDIKELFKLIYKIADKSVCIHRKYGVVIVKDGKIVTTGYSNVPKGLGCNEVGTCPRHKLMNSITKEAEFFERCRVIHAEMDAILNAGDVSKLDGSCLYLLGLDNTTGEIYRDAFPCSLCLRHLIKLSIKEINVFVSNQEIKKYKMEYLDY